MLVQLFFHLSCIAFSSDGLTNSALDERSNRRHEGVVEKYLFANFVGSIAGIEISRDVSAKSLSNYVSAK